MEKKFPILGELDEIPWAAIAPHEPQALKNHYQTLERLAQRGGLAWSEVLSVLLDSRYTKIDEAIAKRKVLQIVSKKCIVCGEPLQFGQFAYNQNMCWNCFQRKVSSIVKEFNEQSDQDLIKYMMAVVAERFGEEW